jgi:hypothetical protein
MKAMEINIHTKNSNNIKQIFCRVLFVGLLAVIFPLGISASGNTDKKVNSTSFGLYQDQSQSPNQEASNSSFFSSSSRLRGFDNGNGNGGEGGEDPFEEGPVEDAYPVVLLLLAAYAVFKWRSASKPSEG